MGEIKMRGIYLGIFFVDEDREKLIELQKGGLLGNVLTENYKIKKKEEELELKLDCISKELEEVKNDKKEIKKQLENKDNIIK